MVPRNKQDEVGVLVMDIGDVCICQNERKEIYEKPLFAFLNNMHLNCEIKSKHSCVIVIYLSEDEDVILIIFSISVAVAVYPLTHIQENACPQKANLTRMVVVSLLTH